MIKRIEDLKIDDEIRVSSYGRNIHIIGVKVHFAGISKNGKVLAFEKSLTSDRTKNVIEWEHYRCEYE